MPQISPMNWLFLILLLLLITTIFMTSMMKQNYHVARAMKIKSSNKNIKW